MEKLNLVGHFNKVETTREHNANTHSVGRILTIVILGFLCKLQDVDEIQQWACEPRTRKFLSENFGIFTIPTCRWINEILSLVKPESLNEVFMKWTAEMLPKFLDGLTIAFDGKTMCSTGKMSNYDKPLHILSAYLCESGLTMSVRLLFCKNKIVSAVFCRLNPCAQYLKHSDFFALIAFSRSRIKPIFCCGGLTSDDEVSFACADVCKTGNGSCCVDGFCIGASQEEMFDTSFSLAVFREAFAISTIYCACASAILPARIFS